MPELVDQQSLLPTRKLFIGALSAAITAGILSGLGALAGSSGAWSFLTLTEVLAFVPIGVGFLFAYTFRDREN